MNKQQKFPNSNDAYCLLRTTDGSETFVDFKDYQKASHFKWHTDFYGRIYNKSKRNKTIFLTRFLLTPEKGEVIDHADGNVLNNRRYNLRVTTQKNNSRNLGLNKNNTSGYKGVSKCGDGRYRAYIAVDYKQIGLGSFQNVKDAAKAYNDAAVKYFGEFARLNHV